MLKLEGISWSPEDGAQILKHIDLEIQSGKLTVVTGPNGGGKTSLAKLIAGVHMPTGGRILLNGEDITDWDVTRRARAGIAYAFQHPVRFKGLTVRDLLNLAAGETLNKGVICDILATVGLCAREYEDRSVDARLSGGESKRIELATVLARKDAKISVFDEPEAGIDLWSFNSLIDAFGELKRTKKGGLLVISHQERILEIADRIVVVAQGVVRESGPAAFMLPKLLIGEKLAICPRGKEGTI
jgi:Fe-S cluster assembly ATP-binding protein